MNDFRISPDDPKLTAYALGELQGDERAAIEAALRDNPEAQATVESVRAFTRELEQALATEGEAADAKSEPVIAAPALPEAINGQQPRRLPDYEPAQGQVLRFPQLYFVIGGLAAACFAVMIVIKGPAPKPELKHYQEVYLKSGGSGSQAVNLPKVEVPEPVAVDAADASIAALPRPEELAKSVATSSAVPREDVAASAAEAAARAKASVFVEADKRQVMDAPHTLLEQVTPKAETFHFKDTMSQAATTSPTPAGNQEKPAVAFYPSPPVQENASSGRRKEAKQAGWAAARRDLASVTASGGLAPAAQAPAGYSGMNKDEVSLSPFYVSSPSRQNAGSVTLSAGTVDGVAPGAGGKAAAVAFGRVRGNVDEEAIVSGHARPPANTEAYAYQHDNAFVTPAQSPFSTFSIDVDTASYANVRRFVQRGQLPPPDAVRIEELVNYFPYHYAPPTAESANGKKAATATPFAAALEVADAPWAPKHRLVRIGLKGREVASADRPTANLVFLLDVSGSMNSPLKLPLVKESMHLLIGKLRPDDRVAIVTYAGNSGLALPSTPARRANEIYAALDALSPGGSTNGAMGIQLAYDIAKANFVTGGINRVILCTDGDFNVGVTSQGELTRLVEEKAKSGVELTALGFGMGNYKDSTLELLADKGNGNYGYIDSRREAEKLLVEQVNGTLMTIAKDVKIQVDFNPHRVASYRLIGYENRALKAEDFNNDAVDAGEIGAGHTVTALYEIVPTGVEDKTAVAPPIDASRYAMPVDPNDARKDRFVPKLAELLTVKIRYKEPEAEVSQKLEFSLKDSGETFADASADFQFAAAVASYGMILRESPHRGSATLNDVVAWSSSAIAKAKEDTAGYRGEFLDLVRHTQSIMR